MNQRTIVVIDDQEPFRRALRAVATASDYTIVGEAANADEASELLDVLVRPDLVIVDVNLGEDSGIALTKQLTEADSMLRVVLVSTVDRHDLPRDAAYAGMVGFVQKSRISPDLLREMVQGSPDEECWHSLQDTS